MLPDPAGIKPMIWSHAGLSNQGWLVNIHQLVQTRIFFYKQFGYFIGKEIGIWELTFWSVYTTVMLWKYLPYATFDRSDQCITTVMLWKYLPYATFDRSDQCTPEWCYENTSLCYIWLFWSVYTSDFMKIPPLCYIWLFWSVYTTVMLWKYFLMLHLIILISVHQSDVMKIPPYATFDCSDQCIPVMLWKYLPCYIWLFWSVYTTVMLWKYFLMLHLIVLISVYQ